MEKARELRKKHILNIFDSIHLATAIISREKVIVSSDSAFDAISEIRREDPRIYS
jgi:predicted nucleic acid-binding protein